MMAMSSTSVRPATERSGTIGAVRFCACGVARLSAPVRRALRQPSIVTRPSLQRHARKIESVEQRQFVRRENDGRAELVELGKQPHQPQRQFRIDVAGRLVGEQDIGPPDHRAGNRGALLFAARQQRRQRVHALAQPHPFEQFGDIVAIRALPAGRARAAAAPRSRTSSGGRAGGIPGTRCRCGGAFRAANPGRARRRRAPNMRHRAARRLQRQQQQAQQRGLARAGRAGEEMERARLDAES